MNGKPASPRTPHANAWRGKDARLQKLRAWRYDGAGQFLPRRLHGPVVQRRDGGLGLADDGGDTLNLVH